MHKEKLNSIDIYYLIKELQILIGSRLDQIYQLDKEELILQFYGSNIKKKILRIIVGKALFLTETKQEYEQQSFCSFLRKHIGNMFLESIEQLASERIVKFTFKSKEDTKYLYVEFLGKGNIILCDNDNIILNSLHHQEFKNRKIKPKEPYKYPEMEHNIFDLRLDNLKELFKKTSKEFLVTSLAIDLGLGGVYSEEICLLADIDKNKKPSALSEHEIEDVFNKINEISNKSLAPKIAYQNNEIVDVMPFELRFYNNKKDFKTFNEALEFYYSDELKTKKPDKYESLINELNRVIEEQKNRIEELKKEESEEREKGELIYQNYKVISDVLDKNRLVKETKLKGRKVVIEIESFK